MCPVAAGFCDSIKKERFSGHLYIPRDTKNKFFTRYKNGRTYLAPYFNATEERGIPNVEDYDQAWSPEIWKPRTWDSEFCDDSGSTVHTQDRPCLCDTDLRMYCIYMELTTESYIKLGISFPDEVFEMFLEYNQITRWTREMGKTLSKNSAGFTLANNPVEYIEPGSLKWATSVKWLATAVSNSPSFYTPALGGKMPIFSPSPVFP